MQVESRPAIAASWRRSALAGLSRETSGLADIGEVNLTTALVRAAHPVLHALGDQLGDSPVCLMLADRDGHVVFQAAGDRRLRTALEDQAIVVGSRLGEDLRGTNGLGTPLEAGSPVAISGAEHYLHAYGRFSCYGSPIRHPLTRRIEGAMDLTIPAEEPNPLFRPLVMRAVRDIEARLLDSARPADRRLFLAFEEATRRRSAPVAVLDADTVLMNRGFSAHLGTAGPEVLRTLLPATAAEGTIVRRLDLGTGTP
ncbi:GAF domain-containing protein, partial [Pseudonocardia xishanensis]|uniref:GAF domain-containing protein n=1 Tax=Pseudonocardia xishanensis TaxID=630995 RepID=UPI0031E5B170